MLRASHFKWLPNTLTLIRMLLAIPICLAAANGRWVLGFWLLVVALATDFLDGLAAKKLHAQTDLGRQLDRRADAVISAGALIGLALAGLVSWWVIVIAPLIALFLAEERFFPFKTGRLYRLRPAVSVSYLFSVWIYLGLTYLSQAYGWRWWYVAVAVVILAGSASLKKHRLRAWLNQQPGANRGLPAKRSRRRA